MNKKEDSKVDVVVVTFNRLKLLKECINALLAQGDSLSHIFVIDNKSTDGTGEFLTNIRNEKIITETLSENIGGAAGFEYGVGKAMSEGSGDYIWIMDDDTIPQIDALNSLVHSAEILKGEFGFLCSNVRWTDGSPSNIATPAKDWPDKINENLVKVEAATFVSILVPRKVILSVGLPIGSMKIWGDDTEYTRRLSTYMPSYFDIKSDVIHKSSYGATTESLKNTTPDRLWRYKNSFRNGIYISRKYDSNKKVVKNVIINIVIGIKALGATDNRFKRFSTAIKGTMAGFRFNPEIKIKNK